MKRGRHLRSLFFRMVRWFGLFCPVGLLLAVLSADTPPADLAFIREDDGNPAIVVGSHRVSRYLIDKYHKRFVLSWQSQNIRLPTAAESRDWLDHFIAQQIVIAHAISLGYEERPAVKHMVARMERHMLARFSGALHPESPAPMRTEEDLRAMFLDSARIVDAIITRFNDKNALYHSLGMDFDKQPAEEQMKRVMQAMKRNNTEGVAEQLGWPYQPFGEIAPIISRTEAGSWQMHHDSDWGVYVILVRATRTRPLPDFERSRPVFEKIVHELDRQTALKRSHLAQLRYAELAVNDTGCAQFLAYCQDQPADAALLPELPSSLSSLVLFSYSNARETIQVNAESFRRSINDQMLRQVPRTIAALRQTVEQHVVEERQLTLARRDGRDSTPRFVQDRKGFSGLQVLDLFEREVLVPKIEITADEIARFYQAHAAEFANAGPIRGRLRSFQQLKAAVDWVQRYRADGTVTDPTVIAEREIEVSEERPLPGLENLRLLALHSPAGSAVGPLSAGGQFHVFVRDRSPETNLAQLPKVQEAIRFRLLRQKLDACIHDLARDLATRYSIENHIDYARYGVESDGRQNSHSQ
jgi:hypothetical protein